MRKNYYTSPLPEHCYTVLPSSGQLIEVRRDEMGYYPCAYSTGDRAYNQVLENYLNTHEGVTKAQAAAMLAGSMFGWKVPAADPSRYDLDGEPVRPGVRKPLPGPRNICMNRPSCCGRNMPPAQRSCWMRR